MKHDGKKLKHFLIALAVPLAVGGLAALITKNSMGVYETIAKPSFAPPGKLFPFVWGALYLLMGVSSYLVCAADAPHAKRMAALVPYGLQLLVNFFWPLLFFLLRAFLFSFLWLLLLLFLVVSMILSFMKVSKTAARLQIPYALWTAFAGILNFAVWFLNR
ncbi:MAG: tryptophan-rich sensory protein [Clostridiales bacterium]|nr:tryptophan-rich sensory protein [Clostridiales bacterium]